MKTCHPLDCIQDNITMQKNLIRKLFHLYIHYKGFGCYNYYVLNYF